MIFGQVSSQNPTYFCNDNNDKKYSVLTGTNPFVIIGSSDVETIDINFRGAPVQRTVEVGEATAMRVFS